MTEYLIVNSRNTVQLIHSIVTDQAQAAVDDSSCGYHYALQWQQLQWSRGKMKLVNVLDYPLYRLKSIGMPINDILHARLSYLSKRLMHPHTELNLWNFLRCRRWCHLKFPLSRLIQVRHHHDTDCGLSSRMGVSSSNSLKSTEMPDFYVKFDLCNANFQSETALQIDRANPPSFATLYGDATWSYCYSR